jgi:hypothetical protein
LSEETGLGGSENTSGRMNELLQRLHEEFGWTTKLLAALFSCNIYTMLQREDKRINRQILPIRMR